MDALLSRLDALVLNPDFAPVLSLVKGARNGIVYGSKVRFPHALVMIMLFRSGTFRQKIKLVLNATRLHARNLSTFAIVYKASMIVLRNLNPAGRGKEGRYDSFFAGLLGGYAVFGRQPGSVSQQIVIYVFARVMLSLAKLAVQPGMHPLSSLITPEARATITDNAWPAFASFTWAFVMYIFRWYPETLVSSLRSSMVYMYVTVMFYSYPLSNADAPADVEQRGNKTNWTHHTAMPTRIIGTHSGLCSYTTNEIPWGDKVNI